MRQPTSRRVLGFTLAELLVGMVILAVIGAGITKLLLNQSRVSEQQRGRIAARQVSRGAMNLLLSEIRMVDAVGGVVSAARDSVTLRVPYALGLLCASAGVTTIGVFPTDSLAYATAGFSGYAWRDSASGSYQYVEGGAALSAGTSAPCTIAGITMPARSVYVSLSPALPAGATVGTPVLLEQQITYRFGASQMLSGRQALWRRVVASGMTEELAMPFDTSRAFRFFVLDADTAQTAVPALLSSIRGLELVLAGQSERVPRGASRVETEPLVTAVFFGNRP